MHERQAHAAHQTFQKSAAAALAAAGDGPGFREGRFCHNGSHAGREIGTVPLSAAPPQTVDANSPEVVAQLESLDDAVFDAIRGKAAALAELRLLWPELKSRLGDGTLAESREQYVRSALSVWHEPAGIESDHDPRRAVNALEVLCVLFDEV